MVKVNKEWYLSKTLWVNFLAFLFVMLQVIFGVMLPLEYQAGALTMINFALRIVTKHPIDWDA